VGSCILMTAKRAFSPASTIDRLSASRVTPCQAFFYHRVERFCLKYSRFSHPDTSHINKKRGETCWFPNKSLTSCLYGGLVRWVFKRSANSHAALIIIIGSLDGFHLFQHAWTIHSYFNSYDRHMHWYDLHLVSEQ